MAQQDALEALYASLLQPKAGFLGLQAYNDPRQADALLQKMGQLDYMNKYPVAQQGAVSAGQQVGGALSGLISRYRGASQSNPNQGFLANISQALQGQGRAGMDSMFPAIAPTQTAPQPMQDDGSGAQPSDPSSGQSSIPQGAPPAAGGAPAQAGGPGMPMGPRSAPGTMPTNPQLARAQQIAASVAAQNPGDAYKPQLAALGYLTQIGYPGALEKLQALGKEQKELQFKDAEILKDTGQGNAANDEIKNRAFDQSTKRWTTTFTDPKGLYLIQQNEQGEKKRVELAPPPNAGAQAAQALANSPDAMKAMLDFYHTNGTVPPGVARGGPAAAKVFWEAEGAYQRASGNYAAASTANKMQAHALNADTTNVTRQMGATQSYLTTMDKNIAAARALGNKLDFGNVTDFNKALQLWDRKTSDPTYAKYTAFFNSVAVEYAKLSSGNMGNTTVSDSQRHETQAIIDKAIGNGGMNAVFDALKDEGQNKVDGYKEHLAQNYAQMQGMGNNERSNLPQGAIAAPPAAAAAVTPPAGASQYTEGQTAYNAQTKQTLTFRNGSWQP